MAPPRKKTTQHPIYLTSRGIVELYNLLYENKILLTGELASLAVQIQNHLKWLSKEGK